MTVPDAAIEAVKAWLDGVDEYGAEHGYSVADDAFWVQGVSIHNLLAAAEPAFREAIAQDAVALRKGMLGNSQFADGYRTACNDLATRIVRGTP